MPVLKSPSPANPDFCKNDLRFIYFGFITQRKQYRCSATDIQQEQTIDCAPIEIEMITRCINDQKSGNAIL